MTFNSSVSRKQWLQFFGVIMLVLIIPALISSAVMAESGVPVTPPVTSPITPPVSPTPTGTPVIVPTPTASATPTATVTPIGTSTPTASPTFVPSTTPTATPTPTLRPTPTATATPTLRPTPTASGTPTATATPTVRPTATATPTPMPTPSNVTPVISTNFLPIARVGRLYKTLISVYDSNIMDNVAVNVSGLPDYTTDLKCTISYSSQGKVYNCIYSGTPRKAGVYLVKVSANDGMGGIAKKSLILIVTR